MASYIENNRPQDGRSVEPITFTQKDAFGLHYPHCDALVVKAIVVQKGLTYMLVDNGSSVNILFTATFDKMKVDHELTYINSPLYGFIGDSLIPRVEFP